VLFTECLDAEIYSTARERLTVSKVPAGVIETAEIVVEIR
jgi:hypothetical protein